MVHMRPKFKLAFPSTISWEPMFSRWTRWSRRNCNALSTFSRQWIRILPFVGRGNRSPDNTSNSLMRFLPSRMSTYRSAIRLLTLTKCELTHFVKVFFWTLSRSSAKWIIILLRSLLMSKQTITNRLKLWFVIARKGVNWSCLRRIRIRRYTPARDPGWGPTGPLKCQSSWLEAYCPRERAPSAMLL